MRLLRTDEAVRSGGRRLAAAGLGRAVAVYFREPGFAGMTFSDLGRNPPGQIIADDLLAGGSAPPGPFSGRRAYPGRRAGCPPPGTATGRFPCSLSFARRRRSPARD